MYLPVTETGLVPATASGDAAVVEELPEGVGEPEMVDIGALHVFCLPGRYCAADGAIATRNFFRL